MTNMSNVHTLTTRSVDLLRAGIAIANGEFLQLSGHVIGHAGVEIPIGIDSIGVSSVGRAIAATTSSSWMPNIVVEVAIKALLAAPCTMPLEIAYLALLSVTTSLARRTTTTTRVVGEAGAAVAAVVVAARATAAAAAATTRRTAVVVATPTLGCEICRVGGVLRVDAGLGRKKKRELTASVVVRVVEETLEDVGDDVVFIEGFPGCCQFVSDALHLGEVGRCREITFVGVAEL